MGKTPARSTPAFWNGTNAWVSISDLTSSHKYISQTREHITDESIAQTGIKKVPKDTLLMSFKLSLGKVAIAGADIYTNEAIMAFLDKKIYDVDIHFMYHYFQAIDWTIGTNKAVKGVTLNKKVLSEKVIELPSIAVQHEIAERMDTLNTVMENLQRQLCLLDELVKSQFVEMFGEYVEDTSHHHKLKHVCDFIDYRGKTPEKSESGIPLITAKNVKDNHFSPTPQEFIPIANYESVMTRGIPKVNDILFTTEAPLGNVCRIPSLYDKFCVGQRIVTIQPHTNNLMPEYLEHTLLSDTFQKKVWQQATGSTVKGIRSKLLIELTIPVPPLTLQNEFAAFAQQADKSKLVLRQLLEKQQTLKAALMQEYFAVH